MSSLTLPRASLFAVSSGFGMRPNIYKKDNGNVVVERAAVFRSGTFRDSAGMQMTYETLHIDQIVNNYKYLRDNNIFADVPVRDGHPGWLIHGTPGTGMVVGWHDNVWSEKVKSPVDGNEYDYLLADLRMTDPAAAEKVLNGTFINRSAEIITYKTNNEAEFWPVYGGVAWVDIPAVEGLKFQSNNVGGDRQMYVFMDQKETGVSGTTTGQVAAAAAGAPALLGVTPPAQSYSINGTVVTDPAAVQAHITSLEMFRSETTETNRVNFVNGLAAANKILASQVDSLVEFARGLSPEQFSNWAKTYEIAPAAPVLGNHVAGATNLSNSAQSGQSQADVDIETAKAIVGQHKMAGTPVETIKKTASYKKLEAAGQAPAL